MFLNHKPPAAQNADRTALREVTAALITPGKKMVAYVTLLVSLAMIGGFVYVRYLKEQPLPVAPPVDAAKTGNPKLIVPIDLRPEPASVPQNTDAFPAAQAAPPYPPGMAPAQQAGQSAQPAQQAAGNPPVDQARLDLAAATARKWSGGFGGDESEPKNLVTQADGTAPAGPQPAGPLQGAPTALAGMLVPTATPGASAYLIANQHLTLRKGTSITCSLDTAISTEQSGFTSCVTDYPVRSMDGKTVLMERGTTIEGEYQRGMNHGAKAVFVLWTRAVTPRGVAVPLNSPGTDTLGRSGLAGTVDNKFWDRYGGALMFSILQDGIAVATTQSGSGGGNTQINLGNTQATGTTAAGEILRQNSDVTPSMTMNQGTSVGITVASDKVFDVYELKLIGAN